MWLRPTFYSTLDVWKRKKTAHEDRCFRNYLKAKQIDPLARLECFMKPFKYPPFPNAEFGIADRLPNPVKGILCRDYITNPLAPHLCGVTSSSYEWCRETYHLISGFTKIEKYPPAAKPIVINETTSEPTKSTKNWVSDSECSPKKKREKRGGSRARFNSNVTSSKKSKKSGASKKFGGDQGVDQPRSPVQSNLERARSILSNPAMFNKSISAGLAGISSSQASTESTRAEYTPLGHETIPVLVSSSCPANTSTMAATSSDLAILKPEMTITSPIKENAVDEEGPFIVPTPEAGDLDFADDEFNLDSILSEVQEVFLTAVPNTSSGKVNKVLGCLNHSLEEIIASTEIKAQLLEATTYLNQHASSEASSLESFLEDLYNNNILLESSSEDIRVTTVDLSKHKKDVIKYGAALLKVKPLADTGAVKEQEARVLEETQ
ncbi:hypothetical protein PIB30_092208 [Stylosanthes scabra]|uniref:Uncharacterized protein n=1 Tax=Stylosanthes scabra TaxID=79078 RepID=A0ABU6UYD6_9FABA|nr:hypothetical protein [Stylosanthes scabra]